MDASYLVAYVAIGLALIAGIYVVCWWDGEDTTIRDVLLVPAFVAVWPILVVLVVFGFIADNSRSVVVKGRKRA